jgi:hypothetical protein
MKFLATMLLLGFLGYLAYDYVQTREANPTPVITLTHHSKADPDPTPTPEPTEYKPQPPDLTTIPVKDGVALTNAKVKELRSRSIVFLCDQGLFEVGFDRLPPKFALYYGPIIARLPAPAVDSGVALPTPTPVPTARVKRERTPIEEANARLGFFSTKESLEGRLKRDQDVIDRWYKQSSFDGGGMSEGEFEGARADFEATSVQLSQLLANGP